MANKRKNLKYSTEASKTMRPMGQNGNAKLMRSTERCLVKVSIKDGVIESHIEDLWARQGLVNPNDIGAAC